MANVYDEYVEPIIQRYIMYDDEEYYSGSQTYFRVYLRQQIGPFRPGFFFNNISFYFDGTNPIAINGTIPQYVRKPPPSGSEQGMVEEDLSEDLSEDEEEATYVTNPDLKGLEDVLNEEFPEEEVRFDVAEQADVDVNLTRFWKIRINVSVEVT